MEINSNILPFGIVFEDGANAKPQISAGLKAYSISDSTGADVGILYGVVLKTYCGAGLKIKDKAIVISFPVPDIDTFESRVLDGLHGCFVIFTSGSFGRRLYPDCGASIPVVYCTKSRRLGSSATMFLSEAEQTERFARSLYNNVVANDVGGSWITGTLTAHKNVLRLLPNFYLDLESWTAKRFWPSTGSFNFDTTLEDAVGITSLALTGFVAAAARENHTGITMTAGFDSRILVAAARDVRNEIEFLTFGEYSTGLDQKMSVLISKELGLLHHLIPMKLATETQKEQWDHLVGHVVRESTRNFFPTLASLKYDLILTGMYGETGRARLYRQDQATINDAQATPEFVLSRLTLPLQRDVVENVAEWLEPIVSLPRSAVLDLAFNELRFGSWAMGQAPVQKAMKLSMMPFSQRNIQAAFMSMEPTLQGKDTLFNALGYAMWPEAMGFPINRYGDYRDWTTRFSKFFDKDKIIRFARDRFAGFR